MQQIAECQVSKTKSFDCSFLWFHWWKIMISKQQHFIFNIFLLTCFLLILVSLVDQSGNVSTALFSSFQRESNQIWPSGTVKNTCIEIASLLADLVLLVYVAHIVVSILTGIIHDSCKYFNMEWHPHRWWNKKIHYPATKWLQCISKMSVNVS